MNYSRTKFVTKLVTFCIALVTVSSHNVFADRTHRTDASFYINYVDDANVKFQNDARIETYSDVGFGVGFAYHYTSQISVGLDTTFQSIAYDAYAPVDDGSVDVYGSTLDNLALAINAEYYFTPKRAAPYITGSFGWSFMDTNVPEGPPGSVCWWDPWFGYICDYYQPTHSTTAFTYGIGLGFRYEVNRTSFFKIEYGQNFLDIDRAKDFDVGSLRIEFGAMY